MKKHFSLNLFFIILHASLFSQIYLEPALVPYRVGDLWGYSDTTGRICITPKYSSTSFFIFDSVTLVSLNDKKGVINARGEELIPCAFDKIIKYNNYFHVVSGNLHGLYTRQYRVITPPKWDNIYGLRMSDYYCVTKAEKSGVMYYDEKNKTSKIIIPLKYTYIYNNSDNVIICKNNSTTDFYDATGKKLTNQKEDIVEMATEIAMAAYDEELYSFTVKKISNTDIPTYIITKTNRESKTVTYTHDTIRGYDAIRQDYLPYNIIPCLKNEKWGIINRKGQQLLANEYDTVKIFGSKTCEIAALQNGVYTLYDANGKNNVEGTFDNVENLLYRRDILSLQKSGLYGLYNFQDLYAIPTEYKKIVDIQSIKGNLFFEVITADNKKGYINTKNMKFYKD